MIPIAMYESDEIIKYLVDKYGNGLLCCHWVSSRQDKPLKVWAYELSPFCKIVRERLVELELPHVYYNAARGSPKRNYLLERTGIFQVPFLEDPNTGVEMFESGDYQVS
ncbi:hypothetical protein SELMODRAFT_423867 [Selaginella moellendorffii]|uniref:GST N-terminal domain-containing protein n=1 Tax=Selaginella moellendorffii TaxID=88036 RepID=D8SN23_SELML|nr:hypothetical protein SELMODRAFT_423867 [Selaginella moellendorffii]